MKFVRIVKAIAYKKNKIAPINSHRHAMINKITTQYTGIKCMSKAINISLKLLPFSNTSKANKLKKIANRMPRILGLQNSIFLQLILINCLRYFSVHHKAFSDSFMYSPAKNFAPNSALAPHYSRGTT